MSLSLLRNGMQPGLLSRLNLTPLLLDEGAIDELRAALNQISVVGFDPVKAMQQARAELMFTYGLVGDPEKPKAFAFAQGVGIIPVHGTLLNRFPYSVGSLTGYTFIRGQLNAMLDDPDVKHIVFDMNSGGGEAAGAAELGDEIYKARGKKPMTAIINAHAYSACYWQASAADNVILTPSGGAGSIGALMVHASFQNAIEKAGIELNIIRAGELKAAINPFENLSDEVRDDLQNRIVDLRDTFAETVARNRGLDTKAVIKQKSRTFDAQTSLSLGLVDAIQSPSEAISAILTGFTSAEPKTEMNQMDKAEIQAMIAEGIATGIAAHMNTTQARKSAVKASPEFKGREALADHLLDTTTMDANAIIGVLAVSPKAGTVTPAADDKPEESAADAKVRGAVNTLLNTMGLSGLIQNDDGAKPPRADPKSKEARVANILKAQAEVLGDDRRPEHMKAIH